MKEYFDSITLFVESSVRPNVHHYLNLLPLRVRQRVAVHRSVRSHRPGTYNPVTPSDRCDLTFRRAYSGQPLAHPRAGWEGSHTVFGKAPPGSKGMRVEARSEFRPTARTKDKLRPKDKRSSERFRR